MAKEKLWSEKVKNIAVNIRKLKFWNSTKNGGLICREYKCKCGYVGKETVLIYSPKKQRLCPKCNSEVRRRV